MSGSPLRDPSRSMIRRPARVAIAALALTASCAAQHAATQHAATHRAIAGERVAAPRAADPPAREYFAIVASESVDQLAVLRFGADGARVERTSTTGIMPADVDGPHGVAVSPDGRWYYVSTAHGTPFGFLWKYALADDSLAGRVMLGNFPATTQITPDGAFAYVVNYNVYGDMVPSSVSIVSTDEMVEVARVPTCTMPHGSRINPQGTRQYSACMMDDIAVEIDTRTFDVTRHFDVAKGRERGVAGAPPAALATAHRSGAHDTGAHGEAARRPVSCSPTWVQPSADGATIFVACTKSNDIVEIDVPSWTMRRRIPAGDGVYNLAATHDGRLLVATNKRGQSVSVFDARTGAELARIPTTRRVVHGVAISGDDRYAFVSQEGVGSEPGAVDVVDLRARRRVASVDVGQQAGGIDFWRMSPSR
jgi:DNA-binding beta-propeller fold protein YncE